MRLTVFPTAHSVDAAELAGRAAVVIDVLRATSSIVTALASGARAIVPVLTPEEAREKAAALPASLLGGERASLRIPGFDLSNSPLEYIPAAVAGRTIVFTTTNGTRAIRAAGAASPVLIAALLNARAVAARLAALQRDVAIVCAGTRDRFSLEDTACAGAVIAALDGQGLPVELDDLAMVARDHFQRHRARLPELLQTSRHGRSLLDLGLGPDLAYCARLDSLALVPIYDGEAITLEAADG